MGTVDKKKNKKIKSSILDSKIKATEIAIVCPTKNQPKKIARLLSSLSKQTIKPGQIIISECGTYIPKLIDKYLIDLNIKYLKSPHMGQVLQRNFAYGYLDKCIRVVINLDDDITFDNDSLEKFILEWNIEKDVSGLPLAGMSFNLLDAQIPKDSRFRKFFLMGVSKKGNVTKAGYASTYFPPLNTKEVEWLIGGATGWDRFVIDSYRHPIDFPTRWAVCEDLMYSYPLYPSHRLLVAKGASAYHNETYKNVSFQQSIFQGMSLVIMRFYFVCSNRGLSRFLFFWMTFGQLGGYFILGCLGSRRSFGLFVGGIKGLAFCLSVLFKQQSSKTLAKKLFYKS